MLRTEHNQRHEYPTHQTPAFVISHTPNKLLPTLSTPTPTFLLFLSHTLPPKHTLLQKPPFKKKTRLTFKPFSSFLLQRLKKTPKYYHFTPTLSRLIPLNKYAVVLAVVVKWNEVMDLVEGVGESSSPPRCSLFSDIVNDVFNRLLETRNHEAITTPDDLRHQLEAHFSRLPSRYNHFLSTVCFRSSI